MHLFTLRYKMDKHLDDKYPRNVAAVHQTTPINERIPTSVLLLQNSSSNANVKRDLPWYRRQQTNVRSCQTGTLWTIAMHAGPIRWSGMISMKLVQNSMLHRSTGWDTQAVSLTKWPPLKSFRHCNASLSNDHRSKIHVSHVEIYPIQS